MAEMNMRHHDVDSIAIEIRDRVLGRVDGFSRVPTIAQTVTDELDKFDVVVDDENRGQATLLR
jgi:hypothetical protein